MNKKLYRSTDDRMIAGVCAGVAEYFGLDATMVRLATVIICLFFGTGVLIYAAAAFIVPERNDNDTDMYDGNYRDIN